MKKRNREGEARTPREKKGRTPFAHGFFWAFLLAAVASLLPEEVYSAVGRLGGELLRQTAVLLPLAVALLLLFLYGGRRGLGRPMLPPRGTRIAVGLLFLVALNNFPFYALIRGKATLSAAWETAVLYVAVTLLTAFCEELLFRGMLLPTLYRYLSGRMAARPQKQVLLLTAVLSSVIFGGVHLFNLTSGAAPSDVLLQVGYSSLVGAAAALLYLATESLFVPVLFHFLYNLGGLLVPTLGAGALRLPPVVISTAALALLTVGFSVYAFFRLSSTRTDRLLRDLPNQV